MLFEFVEKFADHVGMLGVILTLVAYLLISTNKVTANNLTYVWLNIVGAVLLLFSLFFHWNFPSVIIEVAWISISFIGLHRTVKIKKQSIVETVMQAQATGVPVLE
ncbi:MAG: hypothetical protein A3F43_05535 [Gammaproteobacteria bacterium RIFCSPHIGHO2_12_FULL_42_10]|nr:MAG: hypothetical protein A3F43_05535 [Gammaproteobacteria bacterium RIFCSPHIGHO2_12_FULL_42_10]